MTQYTESGACTINWEADQFDNVRLTNSKGHTFSAKSEELHDFIGYEDEGLSEREQTILDDFAKAAMHAMLTTPERFPDPSGVRLAEMAYTYADFMMQERERRIKG